MLFVLIKLHGERLFLRTLCTTNTPPACAAPLAQTCTNLRIPARLCRLAAPVPDGWKQACNLALPCWRRWTTASPGVSAAPRTIPHCAPPSNIIIDHGQRERWKPILFCTPAANLAALDPRLGLPSRSFVVGSLAAAPPTGPLPVKRCRQALPSRTTHKPVARHSFRLSGLTRVIQRLLGALFSISSLRPHMMHKCRHTRQWMSGWRGIHRGSSSAVVAHLISQPVVSR
jgi:hypothetical protein